MELVAKFLEGNKDEGFLKSSIVFKNYTFSISTTNIWKLCKYKLRRERKMTF